jgi:hypothetical protein
MRQTLRGTRDFFTEQKYRFDIGRQFLTYVNFVLLIIAASDKLQAILPLRISEMIILAVPLAFLGSWIFGYFLDTIVRFPQSQMMVSESRSPYWNMAQNKLDKIISLLEEEKG